MRKEFTFFVFIILVETSCHILDDSNGVMFPLSDTNLDVVNDPNKDAFTVDSNFDFDTSIDPGSTLEILFVKFENLSSNGVTIQWLLNKKATGAVEYGETKNYGMSPEKETTFDYSFHLQILSNLKSDTLYHFRVRSEDPERHTIVSKDRTFRTLQK